MEHPVTEMTTGLDPWRSAERRRSPLPFSQEDIALRGHARSSSLRGRCRCWVSPCTGHLFDWHFPKREGVRLDSGVE